VKVNLHETDPIETTTIFPKGDTGVVMQVQPAFYGKARTCNICIVSTCTNSGHPLYRYRLKVTDLGKLVLEDFGEPRKLDVDI